MQFTGKFQAKIYVRFDLGPIVGSLLRTAAAPVEPADGSNGRRDIGVPDLSADHTRLHRIPQPSLQPL